MESRLRVQRKERTVQFADILDDFAPSLRSQTCVSDDYVVALRVKEERPGESDKKGVESHRERQSQRRRGEKPDGREIESKEETYGITGSWRQRGVESWRRPWGQRVNKSQKRKTGSRIEVMGSQQGCESERQRKKSQGVEKKSEREV